MSQKPSCTICFDTGEYINAYGRPSSTPCNICRPEEWQAYLAGVRKRHQPPTTTDNHRQPPTEDPL